MAYIDSVVAQFKLEDTFKVKMPMDMSIILSKSLSPVSENEKDQMKQVPYLSAINSLKYASMATPPDIMYAVSHLGKDSENPGQAHWTATQ